MNDSRFRITIVEDSPSDLQIIQQSIREAGLDCEITAFDDGEKALEFIRDPTSAVPHLMILDLNVPGAEGASVLNSVRGNTRWSRIAVLAFTSSQDPADMARLKALGADHYAIKPTDLAGFSRFGCVIREWLEHKRHPTWRGDDALHAEMGP